jgi:hypothetical protein
MTRTISQTARATGTPRTTKTMTGIISIKIPFCERNDLDERSLRFDARYWQAGMTRLAWPRRNRRRRAEIDSGSFLCHNDSQPSARELIDKKCGCFAKINASKPAGQECVLRRL